MNLAAPAKPNILITGSSGFIGSFLVEEALERGMNVLAAVRPASSRQYLQNPLIKFAELDFSNVAGLSKALSEAARNHGKIDYIIHNAGITKAGKEQLYFDVNTRYTQNFLDALRLAEIAPLKFVYMSSVAACGPGNPETLSPINIEQAPVPISAYGKSKLEAEKLLISQQAIPWVIIRPTAVFGPREKEIFALFKLVKRNLHPWISVKNQQMSFIYVKDLVRVVLDAAVSSLSRKTYIVSDGSTYAGNAIGEYVKKYLGKKALDIAVPGNMVKLIARSLEVLFSITGNTPGLNGEKALELTSVNWNCDISTLVSDLGFKPQYNLESGVKESVEWYLKEGWL